MFANVAIGFLSLVLLVPVTAKAELEPDDEEVVEARQLGECAAAYRWIEFHDREDAMDDRSRELGSGSASKGDAYEVGTQYGYFRGEAFAKLLAAHKGGADAAAALALKIIKDSKCNSR